MKAKLFALVGTLSTLVVFTGFATSIEAKPLSNSSRPSTVLAGVPMEALNLTSEQEEQMKAVWESTRAQIETILTPEQKNQLSEIEASGEQKYRGFAQLNLTSEQKAQIREIRQQSRQQVEGILTPDQLEQMQQMRQNRRPNRSQS